MYAIHCAMPACAASTSCGPSRSPADSAASPVRPKNVAAAISVRNEITPNSQLDP